jgi:hypothetical protein
VLSVLAEKVIGANAKHALSGAIVGVIAHADSVMPNATTGSASAPDSGQPGSGLSGNLLGFASPEKLAVACNLSKRPGQMQHRAKRAEPHLSDTSTQACEAHSGQDNLCLFPNGAPASGITGQSVDNANGYHQRRDNVRFFSGQKHVHGSFLSSVAIAIMI